MESSRKLMERRTQILEEIAGLGPMRMGSVSKQFLPRRRKDGTTVRRGPYLTYTFKKAGRTEGKHLRDDREAELYRGQIERFRRYRVLSAELVEVSQGLADLEAEGKGDCKKNSRS